MTDMIFTSKNPFGPTAFTEEDVGKIIIMQPCKWWLKLWHWVWFRVLRRKRPCYGTYQITEVTDTMTVKIEDHTTRRGK